VLAAPGGRLHLHLAKEALVPRRAVGGGPRGVGRAAPRAGYELDRDRAMQRCHGALENVPGNCSIEGLWRACHWGEGAGGDHHIDVLSGHGEHVARAPGLQLPHAAVLLLQLQHL